MKHIQVITFIFCLVLFSIFSFPKVAQGLGTIHFGGYVVLTIPCTCTPGVFLITYTPLYVEGIPAPIFGTLVMYPTVFRWGYQQFVYPPLMTSWHLGEMSVPGVCLVGAPPACVTIPAYGTIIKTGSSYPGWPTPVSL